MYKSNPTAFAVAFAVASEIGPDFSPGIRTHHKNRALAPGIRSLIWTSDFEAQPTTKALNYKPMRLTLVLLTLTTTAQAQWTIQQSHTTASLRGIHALGNGIAWASGTAGTVLRTTDDGKNWHPLKPSSSDQPDADQNWNALSLPFVVGPKGRIGKLNPTKP